MPGERMRFSAEGRRQQIVEVAMALFARQGFRGTTTRQIAERARVNEAIIFRHFRRKEDLYWAVIEEKCRENPGQGEAGGDLVAHRDEREFFTSIARDILRRNTEDTTLSRLLLFSALERHQLSNRFFRTYVADYYETLAAYIRKRIRAGSFRRVDSLLAARGFLGMIIYHFLIQELFGGKRYQKFDAKKVTDLMTGIWLEGVRSRNGRGARSKTSSKRR